MKAWRDLTLEEKINRQAEAGEQTFWWLLVLSLAVLALFVKVLV